jgi:hypothetical protein
VEEQRDFWNDDFGVFTMSRSSAHWEPTIPLDAAGAPASRLVGVLKGDVNGSWSPPAGSAKLPEGHLEAVAELIGVPIEQWG